MTRARLAVLLVILLAPGVMLAPVWPRAGLGAGEDDILYYYPMRALFHDAVRTGEAPWLNPWTGLGRPYLADPQTAVFYPPTWLFAALPPTWAYGISLWAHYSLAMWGMYRLMRSGGTNRQAAIFGGLVFAFGGFLVAHRAHLAIQHAAAWAPWAMWRLQRLGLAPAESTRVVMKRLAAAAAILAMQCLAGHVQIAALTALGSLVLLIAAALAGASRSDSPPALPDGRGSDQATGQRPVVPPPVRDRCHRQALLGAVGGWLAAWVLAGGLCAVQAWPAWLYLRLCTRSQQSYSGFVENSWSPASLVNWVLPMFFGQRTPNFFDQPYWGVSHQVEQFAYPGLLALLLAALCLRCGWRSNRRCRPWLCLGLFALLLALGDCGPICPWLYYLPGSSLFRVPARALLLVNLAIAVLAAFTLDDLAGPLSPRRVRLLATIKGWLRRPAAFAVLLVAIPAILVLPAIPWLNATNRTAAWHALRPQNPAIWVPFVVALATLITWRFALGRWQSPRWLWLPIGVAVVDLAIVGWTIDVPPDRRTAADLLRPRVAADWRQMVRDDGRRLWVVTGRAGRWLPGEYVDSLDKAAANTNMLFGIYSLTDYGPLQPLTFDTCFGFRPWGEAERAAELLTYDVWMRPCNVGWVLLCDDYWPAPAGAELNQTTPEGWRLYEYPAAAGWAIFEQSDQPAAIRFTRTGLASLVTAVDTWPGSENGLADAPEASGGMPDVNEPEMRRLIVSQLALPGWSARAGSIPLPIEPYQGLLLSVRIPAGAAAEITWRYFPPGLLPGAAVSGLTAAALLAGVLWTRQRPAITPRTSG